MPVIYSQTGHIVTITLNRPQKLNAMNQAMVSELQRAWQQLRADDTARVAVLTGAGDRSFCAGVDVGELADRPDDWYKEAFWQDPTYGFGLSPEEGMPLFKPVIAAINGYCLGGGLTLVLGADIRICADSASFGLPEVKIGTAALTTTLLLPRVVPLGMAAELLLSGDPIDAATALGCGLVNSVYPLPELLPRAHDLAERIAANAPLAVRASKEMLQRGLDMPFAQAFVMAEYLRRALRDTADSREGPLAFKEKRRPDFQGR